MPVNSLGVFDLRELANQLRRERLFINAERESAKCLRTQVVSLTEAFAQQAWVAAQQRRNLQLLVLARQDCQPALQTQRSYEGERLTFQDASASLGYPDAATYADFLLNLRNSPDLLAGCLALGDRCHVERVPGILHTLSAGLYGSCILAADKSLVLQILQQLALLQLAPSDNPRRLLQHGTCAFARLYSTFHANLHTAQLYLTAALHDPIMALLAEDEELIQVDPEKLNGNNDQHNEKQQMFTQRLAILTDLFITGLSDHAFCFPPSVSWLLRQLVNMLNKAGFINEKEVYEICVDLILTLFICPAIVNPEPFGIIEAPVSPTARSNLMQVAQILQKLAMSKYQGWDTSTSQLYSHFDHDCVSRIISAIVDGGSDNLEIPLGEESDLEGVPRSTAWLTLSQLNSLVCFLQTVASSEDDLFDRQQLNNLLARLPSRLRNGHSESSKPKQQDTVKRPGLLSKAVRQRSQTNGDVSDEAGEETTEPVLVFRLPGELDLPELLTEAQILQSEGKHETPPMRCAVDGQDLPDSAETSQSQEKRTRFSLSHDEGSIGNTSDNLEAISEAASNHSEASSLESEGEDQNDNLSDMVSANVSGRGSPNISGRDTPSSQITEGEAPDRAPPVIRPVPKQSRSDIDDKFGKFEIKRQELLGDETVSLVSDTWSTDVLASDSEFVGDMERFPRPPDEGPPHPFIQHSIDISETASEAWSTDVMASDSERMTEVDTDDTASVARSDDTAPSEAGGRGDDPGTPPPLTFRPIARTPRAEDNEMPRFSLAVPPSPTRGNDVSHGNVTGRGGAKADYKRRTMEFVGSVSKPHSLAALESPRMIHVIDKMEGSGRGRGGRIPVRSPNPPLQGLNNEATSASAVGAQLAALSLANHEDPPQPLANQNQGARLSFDDTTPTASFHGPFKASSNFVHPPKFPDPKIKPEEEGDRVFRSSTSLASTSSSSSNAPANPIVPNTDPKITATGAIPKSISFDKTADKEFLDDKKQKKGFFGNFKMSFKKRNAKKGDGGDLGPEGSLGLPRIRRGLSDDSRMHNGSSIEVEDILDKYRGIAAEEPELRTKRPAREVEEECRGLSEEGIFLNAKRKLRIVFSRADLQSWPAAAVREKELVSFLQLQLAEARSMQNRDLVSQLHETLRCAKLFDAEGCRRLVTAVRSDLNARAAIVDYLKRERLKLLSMAAHLTRLTDRVRVESRLNESFLIAFCVRLFLDRREDRFLRFSSEFKSLSMADEKTDLLGSFLAEMAVELEKDSAWHGATDEQRSEALSAIETAVLSRVYPFAFYPNGDGDVSRDQVLHEHIGKLASIITPNHKDLQIPKRFHGECPWPSAQAQVSALASYKTPRDKVRCVTRCANTITNLLDLACDESVPAADEFLPVLIYVVIAANPPALLSTIQYVDSFYPNLPGEDEYYWTQFRSAIEFIKTMDYNV